MRPPHNRFAHLKGVFGPWWVAVNGVWALLSSADVIVTHYAPESFRAAWDAEWIAPKWGWSVWAIGFLIITAASAFEYSFRYIRKHENAAAQRETHLQTELVNAENTAKLPADPTVVLLRERQRLEVELQPLLEIEECGIQVYPAIKVGKDERDYRIEHIARLRRDIEEIGRQLLKAEAKRSKPQTSRDWAGDWRLAEDGFRRHLQSNVRADWEHSSIDSIETWALSGNNRHIVGEVEAFCIQSGKLLSVSPVGNKLSADIKSQADDLNRWLYFLKEKYGLSDMSMGVGTTANGVDQHTVSIGSIDNLAMVSVRACVECAGMTL